VCGYYGNKQAEICAVEERELSQGRYLTRGREVETTKLCALATAN